MTVKERKEGYQSKSSLEQPDQVDCDLWLLAAESVKGDPEPQAASRIIKAQRVSVSGSSGSR